jgi:hypothetical protein
MESNFRTNLIMKHFKIQVKVDDLFRLNPIMKILLVRK